jgi:hypothetical protein
LSVEEERQLREILKEGKGIAGISQAMGKTRVAVRAKIYHLGLSVVDATEAPQHVAASVASIASTPQLFVEEKPTDCTLHEKLVTIPLSLLDSISAPIPKDTDFFALQLKRGGPLPSVREKQTLVKGSYFRSSYWLSIQRVVCSEIMIVFFYFQNNK